MAGWGKQGSLEETESCLGKVIKVSEGADAVELGSVRRWLEPKEFECPIHTDEAAARAAGYKTSLRRHPWHLLMLFQRIGSLVTNHSNLVTSPAKYLFR